MHHAGAPFSPILTARVLADIEGFALVKKKQLARKSRLYIRVHGGVLSAHVNAKASTSWDVNLIGSKIQSSGRRSFSISLKSGVSLYITLVLAGASNTLDEWLEVLGVSSTRRLEDSFEVGEKVGDGAYATVRKGREKASGDMVAIKTIVKRQFDATMARELDRELLATTSLQTPGIIRTRAVYNTQDKVHLVMDLMAGGTLKERVQANGGFVSETIAAPIVEETLRTLAHLHRVGVVHRDVKLENILCDTPSLPSRRTLLCDFGYVNFLQPGAETLRSLVGTPVYVAPEIVARSDYGAAVDVFAVGVMLFRMVSGSYPYDGGDDDEKTMQLIAEGNLQFPGNKWRSISTSCKLLVRGMLQKSSRLRLSAEGALHHDWFTQHLPVTSTTKPGYKISPTDNVTVAPSLPKPVNISGLSPSDAQNAENTRAINERMENRVWEMYRSNMIDREGTKHRGIPVYLKPRNMTRLRVLVCMIVFKTRLELTAGLRRPLAKSKPLDPGAHPVQYAPLSTTEMLQTSDLSTTTGPSTIQSLSALDGLPPAQTVLPASTADARARTQNRETNNVDLEHSIISSGPEQPSGVPDRPENQSKDVNANRRGKVSNRTTTHGRFLSIRGDGRRFPSFRSTFSHTSGHRP
jgi:calcium/calmodulin-dependent protein kinase I